MTGLKHIFGTALLAFAGTFSAFGAQTLSVKFNAPEEITVGGKVIPVRGSFKDGFFGLGSSGVSFPAAALGLCGNRGTILFDFKLEKFEKDLMKNRYCVSLRTSRQTSLLFWIQPVKPICRVHFSDKEKNSRFDSKEQFVPGRVCRIGISWDGNDIRIYHDGILRGTVPQPLPLGSGVTRLCIGRFRDGYLDNTSPLPDDCLIANLKVWDSALTPEEIMKECGVKVVPAAEQHPQILSVPAVSGEPPAIDGTLADRAWDSSAGMIGLTDGSAPGAGWNQPENSFTALYDSQNLYLGLRTIFPGRVPMRYGDRRTDGREPEVWGSESFEIYIRAHGETYRFGGNAAGGFTESKGLDTAWNGEWKYAATTKMRIDDTQLFEAEAAIPWKTLGLDAPPREGLEFNFCRSWLIPEVGAASSTSPDGLYGKGAFFPKMLFIPDTPSMRLEKRGTPADGLLEQKAVFTSGRPASLTYSVELLNMNGSAAPVPAYASSFRIKAGEKLEKNISIPIRLPGYDALLFTLSDGKSARMRQILPFRLNSDLFTVRPKFYQERVDLELKHAMILGRLGSAESVIELAAPDGKVIGSIDAKNERISFPFRKSNPAGAYRFVLKRKSDGKEIFSRKLNYPGFGEWQNMTFDNRIIPPYTPLTSKGGGNPEFSVQMWGRCYNWEKGRLFPTRIMSQKQQLLKGPVVLAAGGREVGGTDLRIGNKAAHRIELSTSGENESLHADADSWIEYDGIQYNRVVLRASGKTGPVAVRIPLDPKLVRYLHTSDSLAWGTRLTEKVNDGTRTFRFFPVVWVGNEELGLSFFAEGHHTWKTKSGQVFSLVKSAESASLEVRIADSLSPGETLEFEFGLLASPVKPFPADYPLNTFHFAVCAGMNRPGAPVYTINSQSCGIDKAWEKSWSEWIPPALAAVKKSGGILAPYQMDGMLSTEYPEATAFRDDWKIVPDFTLDYTADGKKEYISWMCPASDASKFFVYKFKEMLKRYRIGGVYLDYGIVPVCGNAAHGCTERTPLLAQREFIRRLALAQLDAGIAQPVIILHNTDSVQLPAMTFASHLFNGENIRQHSSTLMHNGKDILDTYTLTPFASELNSLPFGLTNSVYHAQDRLLPQFGGTDEDQELYKFRLTKAVMCGTLVHNTMPAMARLHYGIFDKVIRYYRAFGVPESEFFGYWKAPAKVIRGKDIYVSVYKNRTGTAALAVIAHIGREHVDQDVEIVFNSAMLGMKPFGKGVELLTADDPQYSELFRLRAKGGIPISRAELKLGDFGVRLKSVSNDRLAMRLNYHSFALVELRP